MLSKFIVKNKDVLVSVFTSLLLNLLKLQAMGGVKGWLIKTLGKAFAKEFVEFIHVNVDYIEMNYKLKGTASNENRNEATDDLNDIIS